MRQAFRDATVALMDKDERLVVLLGDIGVYAFSEGAKRHPNRLLNFGIMEQSMVGFASGLASAGFIPVLHSIAPFLVERALEQIKVDFGYQNLGGNLVSVGGSFDYAALGGTHHSPGDVAALLSVPGVEIFTPGHSDEVRDLVENHYLNDRVTYIRLSESSNSSTFLRGGEKIREVQGGNRGAVIVFGPLLDTVIDSAKNLDVSIIYTNCVHADVFRFAGERNIGRLFIVEPFYERTTAPLVFESGFSFKSVKFAGFPRAFSHRYGTLREHVKDAGLDTASLTEKLEHFFGA
jgi:transketolase